MSTGPNHDRVDVAVVGAGAAGLATAIFAARRNPRLRITAFDGAGKLGAKILVSGGGRCNVTNVEVRPEDYFGGSRNVLRRVLRAFSSQDARAFFEQIGVPLHEEEDGKLFPDSNQARTVVDALRREADRRGVTILTGHRVERIEPRGVNAGTDAAHFALDVRAGGKEQAEHHTFLARSVVLATGGLSLPRTGSDGAGYQIAQSLGHSLVPTTPALVPLLLDGDFHAPLSGIAHDAELAVFAEGQAAVRLRGSLLWTHFGISGPLALNASRFWLRAKQARQDVRAMLCFTPGCDFARAEQHFVAEAARRPRTHLRTAVAECVPARLAEALLGAITVSPNVPLGQLSREDRRRLVHALVEWPLPVRGSRGYTHAEVTAGGVPLSEVDPATMASRCCPNLYLAGEILDADGRIGGFNFQWAWSSGYVAGSAVATRQA